LFGTQH